MSPATINQSSFPLFLPKIPKRVEPNYSALSFNWRKTFKNWQIEMGQKNVGMRIKSSLQHNFQIFACSWRCDGLGWLIVMTKGSRITLKPSWYKIASFEILMIQLYAEGDQMGCWSCYPAYESILRVINGIFFSLFYQETILQSERKLKCTERNLGASS